MISHNEGTFISFFKGRRIIPEAAEGSIMNFIPGLLSHKAAMQCHHEPGQTNQSGNL